MTVLATHAFMKPHHAAALPPRADCGKILHLPRAAELNTPHDPAVFENILRLRIAKPGFWPTNLQAEAV